MLFAEIQQKIQQARALDFGQIFTDCIELFKKVWLQGLIMFLIMIAFTIPFLLIVYLPLIMVGIADATDPGAIDTLGPIAMIFVLVAYLLFVFAMIVITFGLKAGYYRIVRQKEINSVSGNDYFFFLKKPYLNKTINLALSYFGISLIAMLLCVLPVIYVMVPLSLLPVFYAFNPELSTSNLIKGSFELGNKKWLLIFGLTLIGGILSYIVGILMCFIGVYVTMSFVFLPPYLVYKNTIGFEDPDTDMSLIGEDQNF